MAYQHCLQLWTECAQATVVAMDNVKRVSFWVILHHLRPGVTKAKANGKWMFNSVMNIMPLYDKEN